MPTSSVPKCTRDAGSDARCRNITGSRWSWGTTAGVVGLTRALCSAVG